MEVCWLIIHCFGLNFFSCFFFLTGEFVGVQAKENKGMKECIWFARCINLIYSPTYSRPPQHLLA